MRKFNFVSMNNTDEPLLQLDFDETNRHQQSNQIQRHSQPPQYHRPNHDSQHLISTDFKQPLQQRQHQQTVILLPTPTQQASAAFTHPNQQHHHQHHHQSAVDSSDKTISALTSHPTIYSSGHSDNRRLLLVRESGDCIDTNRHSPTDTQNSLAADRHSLISLSSDSSENEEIVNVNAIDANVISNRDTSVDTSLHLPDDTVEVNLLVDTSMDSRESQPLLGIGRDTHDFVYNNFPGKFQMSSARELQCIYSTITPFEIVDRLCECESFCVTYVVYRDSCVRRSTTTMRVDDGEVFTDIFVLVILSLWRATEWRIQRQLGIAYNV